ncbi:toxin-antitoxin system antitoxin subunit [Listeria monocytogenes]|nr:toxin-antitoxin system antitoxin subunit [Listeria monocytogenes]
MATITFYVTEEEKEFIQNRANCLGVTISELMRKNLFESLENQIDLEIYYKAIAQHEEKEESVSLYEMKKALDL